MHFSRSLARAGQAMLGLSVLVAAACTPAAPPAATSAPAPPAASSPAPAAGKPATSPVASPATKPGASPAASPAANPSPAAASQIDASLAPTWAGKTVTMVIGYEVGGGYDSWGRLVARHIGRFLPGTPNVVPQNQGGANSRVATNAIYSAKPDGLTLGIVDRNIPTFQQREGQSEANRFDATKLTWIGSANSEVQVMLVHKRAGVKTISDLKGKTLRIGHEGPGSAPHINQLILEQGLGIDLESVFGYKGSSGSRLAVERGETDVIMGTWDSIKRSQGDQIQAGDLIPLVQIGPEPSTDPLLKGVPVAETLMKDAPADIKQVLESSSKPYAWARPFVAPPNLDPRVAATMRGAFVAALNSPELKAEAQQLKFDVEPVDGTRVQQLVLEYMATPKAIVERLDQMIQADSPQ